LETFNENLDQFYDEATRESGMSRDEINAYFETKALRTALSKIVVEPSTTSVWVNARHILVETEQEALDIIDALNAGESFSDLARVNSTDTGSATQGGELGWADASLYIDTFAEQVRTLPIGEISAPVQTDFGYHIIQVNARENREITESQIDQKRQEAFDEWVSGLRDKEEYNYEIKDAWIDHVPSDPPFIYRPR
jgi:foldase protein PrsA